MSSPIAYDFEWDPTKAFANFDKHGLTFEQAATVFLDPLALSVYDEIHSDEEERWFTVGHTVDGALAVVSHTFQSTSPVQAKVRIISARPATRTERRSYEEEPR